MKKNYLSIALWLFAVTAFAQKTYPTTMSITFSGGNNGVLAAIGNDCGNNDILITYNSVDGIMQVDVNKVCHTWSFIQHWMGNCYAPSIVFKPGARYHEIRVKSTASHTTGLTINYSAAGGSGCSGSIGKTIPGQSYKINQPDTWEIKFFKLGGTADTIFQEVQYFFDNGTYFFDYIYYGDAAVPPVPTVDQVKDKIVREDAGIQNVTLNNISIPNRLNDGLVIEAVTKKDGILKDVQFVDIGGGEYIDESTKTATLQFTPVKGMAGQNDSIIVTIKDTIRSTQKTMSFLVTLLPGNALNGIDENIFVYPTIVTDQVAIDFPSVVKGNIDIIDIVGNIVFSQSITAENVKLNISDVAPGIYIIRISDAGSSITRKIIKE